MTTFDLIGVVELTLSASIVITTLSVVIGRDAAQRIKLAATLLGWFVIVVILAATEVLHYQNGIGTPGLGLAVVLPIGLLWLALLRIPSLRHGLDFAPLAVLVAVQTIRILGANFLLLQANNRLPAPFAPLAGWADIAVGALALPVAWLVIRKARAWRAVLFTWNLLGLADLITAITLGALSAPGPLRRIFAEPGTGIMTTLPWLLIPGFLVPLFATAHLAIFYRLAKPAHVRDSIETKSGQAQKPGNFLPRAAN